MRFREAGKNVPVVDGVGAVSEPADVPQSGALRRAKEWSDPGPGLRLPGGQPQRSRILRPTGVLKQWPRLRASADRDRVGAGQGWSKECRSSDAL